LSSVVVLKLTRIPRFGSQDLRHSADATPANTGYTHTHTHTQTSSYIDAICAVFESICTAHVQKLTFPSFRSKF